MASNEKQPKASLLHRLFGITGQSSRQATKEVSQIFKKELVPIPQFAKLPVELQIKIWEAFVALEPPKSQHKRHQRLFMSGFVKLPGGFYIQNQLRWTKCIDVAAALRACHLSREVAIKYCLSLSLEGWNECPYEERNHLEDLGHKLPQFGDPSTAPSQRTWGDLVDYGGELPFDISSIPGVSSESVIGTIRFLVVDEAYLNRHRLKEAARIGCSA